MKTTLIEIFSLPTFEGRLNHIINMILRERIGANKNILKFLILSLEVSLVSSFRASLNGWRIPFTPTLLGPLRFWVNLRILRSNKVIRATLIKTLIRRIINLINLIISRCGNTSIEFKSIAFNLPNEKIYFIRV